MVITEIKTLKGKTETTYLVLEEFGTADEEDLAVVLILIFKLLQINQSNESNWFPSFMIEYGTTAHKNNGRFT